MSTSADGELPFVAQPPGPLADLTAAATVAASHWGLAVPALLRVGMNGIFAAGEEVVLRVCRPTAPAEQAVWLSGELARAGVRVPAAARHDVVRVGDLSVLAVERIRPSAAIDWTEVGAMVARVNALDPARIRGR
ncbi:MAG: hypothetical protein JWM12_36, partial [Ilumatobacteraceae bacterium]|nr:hypothetical protein [Ilumatobacteraceae bacterium]